MAPTTSLADLLAARHVVVVGATESSFVGTVTQRNLDRHGWPGRISQVHPRNREVAGRPCVPALADLDEAPDIAVVLAPPRAVPQILEDAEAVGTRWAVIPGAGEADAGPQAHVIAEHLRRPDRRIRVVGPNCMGIVAPPEHLTAYIGTCPASLRSGGVAFLSQSGAVVEAVITMGPRIGYRMLASTGNEVHLSTEDVIEFLLDEGRTTTILLSQEGIEEPARYFALLGRAADADVTIAVLRVGRSAVSRAAALTHTGAITGDWDLWARLARRQGATVVETLDELHEVGSIAQDRAMRPRSPRLWVVTNSGGQGAQIADVLDRFDHVELPQPSAAHLADFAEAFPHAGRPSNPMDLWALAHWEEAYGAGYRMIARHADGGTLVVAADTPPDQGAFEAELGAGMVRLAHEATADSDGWRVVHLTPLHAPLHPAVEAEIVRLGCSSLRGASGIRALAQLLTPGGPRVPPERLAVMGAWGTSGDRMPHERALAMLDRLGVAVPRTALCTSVEEAVGAARGFRAPLVVKAVGPAHRAKVGGVALGLHPDDVPAVCTRMAAIPGCTGFELVEQVSADLELLVHVAVDAQLGPRATLGAGGALTEQAGFAVSDLAPETAAEARDLLRRTVGAQVDEDVAAAWTAAVCNLLVALGSALRTGDAVEIEINPLAVDRLNGRAVAIDVLARGGQS